MLLSIFDFFSFQDPL